MTSGPAAMDTPARTGQWGAELLPGGGVQFRVWAPGQPTLRLLVDGAEREMARTDDGWFELVDDSLKPGTVYAFVTADGTAVPDPASRLQASDVHGPSVVVDPTYGWRHPWQGRPWEEAVIYELHVGCFTPEGTFAAAATRLDHLAGLGVTAIEIMPVAQFSGARGWGYDGVLPYAPHPAYGSPNDMRAFIDEAHARGIMVLLDVVYNHFGPDGNYLPKLAPDFFDPARDTPWGPGIAYDRAPVRAFFIENALYWLDAYALDGLRLDAIDQIVDPSPTHILQELAEQVRARFPERQIHLTTEDNCNITWLHERQGGRVSHYTGEWNDDFHNAAHVLLTGEDEGYYADFVDAPARHLARCLAEGFAFQGDAANLSRGQPSAHLPPTAFVNFLQNHDQIGNRARGERLGLLADGAALRALTAILLLSPSIPLLFMGDEWSETRPFLFFTDFDGELGAAVRDGRRREFEGFSSFSSQGDTEAIPDPNAIETFRASKIDWAMPGSAEGDRSVDRFKSLLGLRRERIVPLLAHAGSHAGTVISAEASALAIDWRFGPALLQLRANLSDTPAPPTNFSGKPIFVLARKAEDADSPPWSVVVALASATDAGA